MHVLFGLILTVLLFLLLRQWGKMDDTEKRKGLFWGVVMLLAVVCTLLVITGRLHILGAIAAALSPLIYRGWRALQLWLIWRRIQGAGHQGHQAGDSGGQSRQQHRQARSDGGMSPDEAREILDVGREATREEIVKAHRRLIQKVHPDHGGTDALAARVNEAKSVLLSALKD